MAQNETSVSGDVVWQDGDDLSETNLTRTAAKTNLTDYVERGLGFVVDYGANTLDIGSGHVIIQDGINAYDLFPSSISGISLPATSGMNYVYATHDPNTDDDITYHIDDDDTPPTDPSLKIGTVDTANDTSTALNRDPSIDAADVILAGRQLDSDDDGVFENADVDALTNFSAGDALSAYPLDLGTDTNHPGLPLPDSDYRAVKSVDSSTTTTVTTADENEIRVDPSSAAVTVTLASNDAQDGNTIRIWDAGHASSTNAITVDTEGSETFGNGDSSKTISADGAFITVQWDDTLSAWLTDRQVQRESVSTNSATINSGDGVGFRSSWSTSSISIGTWQQVSSTRPAKVAFWGRAETDGTTKGVIKFEVDYSGGTTADLSEDEWLIDADSGSNALDVHGFAFDLPAGSQYRLVNDSDPTNNNTIRTSLEMVL